MLKNILILSSILLTGCNKYQPIIDNEFIYYLDLYRAHKNQYLGTEDIRPIDIIFHSQSDTAIGRCIISSNGHRVIEIDPSFWFYVSNWDKEVLFYHEMGHCDLNRGHSNPQSIMEQYHIGGYVYSQNKTYYLMELFQNILAIPQSLKYSDSGGTNGEGIDTISRTHRCWEDHIR